MPCKESAGRAYTFCCPYLLRFSEHSPLGYFLFMIHHNLLAVCSLHLAFDMRLRLCLPHSRGVTVVMQDVTETKHIYVLNAECYVHNYRKFSANLALSPERCSEAKSLNPCHSPRRVWFRVISDFLTMHFVDDLGSVYTPTSVWSIG
jgi:hypothetical protein